MIILQTKDLRKTYGAGEAEVHALDGVNRLWKKASLWRLWGRPVPENPPAHMLGGLEPTHQRHRHGGRQGALHPER